MSERRARRREQLECEIERRRLGGIDGVGRPGGLGMGMIVGGSKHFEPVGK